MRAEAEQKSLEAEQHNLEAERRSLEVEQVRRELAGRGRAAQERGRSGSAARASRRAASATARAATASRRPGKEPRRISFSLREALNKKDKEILELHGQVSGKTKELLNVREASLVHEREKTEAVDRALASERARARSESGA